MTEEKNNRFLKRLTTPLGIGTAIVVSAGLGFALYHLRKKLNKSDSKAQKLIERIREKIKEEQKTDPNTYSEELIKLVYECTPLVAQEKYNKIKLEWIKERTEALEDIPKYVEIGTKYSQKLVKQMLESMFQIVKEAGGSPQVFVTVERERRKNSKQAMLEYTKLLNLLDSRATARPNRKKLTVELVREVMEFQKELFTDMVKKGGRKKFKIPSMLAAWVIDKAYETFGVDAASQEFKKIGFGPHAKTTDS